MNFGEMVAATFDDMNYSSSPPTVVVNRVKRWINEAHRAVLRKPNLKSLRQRTLPFDSVASQPYAALPAAFERVDFIRQVGNDRRLWYRTRDYIASADPGDRAIGTPQVYAPEGLQPSIVRPDETGIWVVSTAAGDTTQTARMVGITVNGDIQAEATASLNGVTRVQFGSATDWVSLVKPFTLDAAAVGDVEFYDASSSGNLLARIRIGATSVLYQAIRLWPTPSDALTYEVNGQIQVPTLVNDEDLPLIPISYVDMLPAYARFRLYRKEGDAQRALMNKSEYDELNEQLNEFQEFPDDYHPRSGSYPETFRHSNLGSWFPPDSSLL